MFFTKNPPGFYIETIHKEYKTVDPVFFNLDDFAWTADLEKNADKIIAELDPVFAPDFDGLTVNPEDRFQFPPKIWKGYPFYFNGFKFKKHLANFPFIKEKLSTIPNLISATITVLEPGSRLLPHNGNSNGVMRYHMGLKIPAPMPQVGFIIAGNEVSWERGKAFMFCNMHVHSVHNLTDQRRYVLMLDVVRPEFSSIKRRICAHTLGQIATNVTADFVRKIFGVKNEAKVDVSKPLTYKPNKGDTNPDDKSFKKNFLTGIENITKWFYIAILSTVLAFKKMN